MAEDVKTNVPPAYWKVEEVAARWRVSKMTVYRMCRSRKIPCLMVSGSFRIPWAAIKEYEKTHMS